MALTLNDVAKGVEKTIKIPRLEKCNECLGSGAKSEDDVVTCHECNGSGRVTRTRRTPFGIFQTTAPCNVCQGSGQVIKNVCSACKGNGRLEKDAKVKISIPAGVEEGMRLRVGGEGESGVKGGPPGDLYVVIHVEEHNVFTRDGDDLFMEVPISFTQAVFGDTIEVPTLEGKAKLKIPEGTDTHTIFRLKNNGIPHLGRSGVGDQQIRVIIETPKKLSKKQSELLKDYAKESGDAPSKSFFKKIFDKI